jgi:hypothetical protein
MRKLIATVVLSIMTMGLSFAGENPTLFKEISRKLKIDLTKVDLKKSENNFVIVQFKIINQEVSIIDIKGSTELQTLIINELEQMFIKSDSDPTVIHTYKFNFEDEK